jgi:hypothetical protein
MIAALGGERRSPPDVPGAAMMDWIDKARHFLWAFVELAFLAVLTIVLIYLLLGDNSGSYVKSVADNVLHFAGGVPTPSLIGLAIVGMLIYLIAQRAKQSR